MRVFDKPKDAVPSEPHERLSERQAPPPHLPEPPPPSRDGFEARALPKPPDLIRQSKDLKAQVVGLEARRGELLGMRPEDLRTHLGDLEDAMVSAREVGAHAGRALEVTDLRMTQLRAKQQALQEKAKAEGAQLRAELERIQQDASLGVKEKRKQLGELRQDFDGRIHVTEERLRSLQASTDQQLRSNGDLLGRARKELSDHLSGLMERNNALVERVNRFPAAIDAQTRVLAKAEQALKDASGFWAQITGERASKLALRDAAKATLARLERDSGASWVALNELEKEMQGADVQGLKDKLRGFGEAEDRLKGDLVKSAASSREQIAELRRELGRQGSELEAAIRQLGQAGEAQVADVSSRVVSHDQVSGRELASVEQELAEAAQERQQTEQLAREHPDLERRARAIRDSLLEAHERQLDVRMNEAALLQKAAKGLRTIEGVQKDVQAAMTKLQKDGDSPELGRTITALKEKIAAAAKGNEGLEANREALDALQAQLAKLESARAAQEKYTAKIEQLRERMKQAADSLSSASTGSEVEAVLARQFEAVDQQLNALMAEHDEGGFGLDSMKEQVAQLKIDMFNHADRLMAQVEERTQVKADADVAKQRLAFWSSGSTFGVGGEPANAYSCDQNFVNAWNAAVKAKKRGILESSPKFKVKETGKGEVSMSDSDFRALMRTKALDAYNANLSRFESLRVSWRTAEPSARAPIELEMAAVRGNLERLNQNVLSTPEMAKVLKAKGLDPTARLQGLDRSVSPELRMSMAITQARLAIAQGVKPKASAEGINGAQFLRADALGPYTLVFKAKPSWNDTDGMRNSIAKSDELRNSYLASRMAARMGLPVPPSTMAMIDGRLGLVQECVAKVTPMSDTKSQTWRVVDGRKPDDPKTTMERSKLEAMVVGKLAIGDTDGHTGNAGLTESGEPWGWDHDLSFPGQDDLGYHRNMFANIPGLDQPMTTQTRNLLRNLDVGAQMEELKRDQEAYAEMDPTLEPLSQEKLDIHRLRLELLKAAATREPPLSLNQINAIMTAPHEIQDVGGEQSWRSQGQSEFQGIHGRIVGDGTKPIDWDAASRLLGAAIEKASRGETPWQRYEASVKKRQAALLAKPKVEAVESVASSEAGSVAEVSSVAASVVGSVAKQSTDDEPDFS